MPYPIRWLDEKFKKEGFETGDARISIASGMLGGFGIVTLPTLDDFLKAAKMNGAKIIQYQVVFHRRIFPYFFANGICYKLNDKIVEEEYVY